MSNDLDLEDQIADRLQRMDAFAFLLQECAKRDQRERAVFESISSTWFELREMMQNRKMCTFQAQGGNYET